MSLENIQGTDEHNALQLSSSGAGVNLGVES